MKIKPEGDNSSQKLPGMQLRKSVLIVWILNISGSDVPNWPFFFSVRLFVRYGKELYVALYYVPLTML